MFRLLFVNLNFSRFVLGRFFTLCADQILLFAIPLIVYRNTGSITQSGIVFFLEWLPRVISLPVSGILADRFGGRLLSIISDFMRGISCLVVALLLTIHNEYSFYILSALAIVSSFFQAQSLIAIESLVPNIFGSSKLIQVQSLLQAIIQLSMIAGPIVCASMLLIIDKNGLLFLASCIYIVCFLNTIFLQFDNPVYDKEHGVSFIKKIQLSVSLIFNQHKLRYLTLESMAVNLLFGVLMGQASIISISAFNVTDQEFSLVQLSLGIATISALSFSGKVFEKWEGVNICMTSIILIFSGCIVVALSKSFSVFIFGYAVMMAALSFFNVYMRAERVKLIPEGDRGKVISVMVMLNQIPLPLSGILISLYAESLGPQNLLLTSVLSISILNILLFSLYRSKRKLKIKEYTNQN
ncbi:MFS transporter [Photobacterium sp. WH77]|uniref:MFS transporter n=1 Tax=unclassified Photobacterium TaxID=2628852 RepID=UPI001EDBCCAF|nr:MULTISPECIES: MFS transporter [unclassified Photobacterium]MCG2835526.1 MFS transporter [Photobacterium sp. WH77]MCG2843139.1 MFS transporter [Photobacterium sp. WH80]